MKRNRNTTVRIQSESDIRIKLELMGFLETAPGWTGQRHAHGFWELVYMARGRG